MHHLIVRYLRTAFRFFKRKNFSGHLPYFLIGNKNPLIPIGKESTQEFEGTK